MKLFFKNIILFILGLSLFFGVNSIINYIIIANTDSNIQRSKVLIIGDSHLQKALDPNLIDYAQNICQGDEPYILTFWKLKKVFNKVMPNKVIVGFAPHNISAQNDLKFSKRKWSSVMFKRSYSIENFKTIEDINIDYIEYYKILLKNIGFYPKKNHFQYIGAYTNSNFSDISNSDSVKERHYYFNKKKLGISKTTISYMDSIINLCISKGVKPILVSSPIHESYYRLIPLTIKTRFEELKKQFSSKGAIIIDKTIDFYPDSLYYDSDHLNIKGANRFTSEIKKMIELSQD